MIEDNDELRAKINAETGKIGWKELERHFARGVVITVDTAWTWWKSPPASPRTTGPRWSGG